MSSQRAQLQTTLSQQMNKPTFQLKPLGVALRLKTTQKKEVSTIQRNIHKQFYNSLTDTPTEQAILLSQSTSHTGAHLMQPSREAYVTIVTPSFLSMHRASGCKYRPNGNAHSVFSLKPTTAVPCGPAVTSPHPTMTSTTLTTISFSCLPSLALRPLCSKA